LAIAENSQLAWGYRLHPRQFAPLKRADLARLSWRDWRATSPSSRVRLLGWRRCA